MAHEFTYNNFEISLVVFMPNITYKSCYYLDKYICNQLGGFSYEKFYPLELAVMNNFTTM